MLDVHHIQVSYPNHLYESVFLHLTMDLDYDVNGARSTARELMAMKEHLFRRKLSLAVMLFNDKEVITNIARLSIKFEPSG